MNNNNSDTVKRYPFYFGSKEEPLLGWLHTTENTEHSNTCFVICPALAVEYMNSYRSLRYIADSLAMEGIPTLRFDYHGTGDSSGIEEDDKRLEHWIRSIEQASTEIKNITSCDKIGLLGFRIGGAFAAIATKKLPVDFLILWATPSSGKKYIREVKLLEMTAEIQSQQKNVVSYLDAGGMVYWPQTTEDINNIDLTKIKPQAEHILIIPREETISDLKIFNAWKQSNLNVESKPLLGSMNMLVDSHLTIIPHNSIKEIVQWVTNTTQKNASDIVNKAAAEIEQRSTYTNFLNDYTCNSKYDSIEIEESIIQYGTNNSSIAILTQSKASKNSNLPTIILSNSGANHRVGPSRLYVLIARKLSLLGFSCLRLDMTGLGDSICLDSSKENIEYINSSSSEIRNAIEKLNHEKVEREYILMGLCSGAYFSFHASLDLKDSKIVEIILINPLTFYWEEGMLEGDSPTRDFSTWSWYRQAFTMSTSWRKLLKGNIDFKNLFQTLRSRIWLKFSSKFQYLRNNSTIKDINKHKEQLSIDLKAISENNTFIQFVLSRRDPGYDILKTNAGKAMKKLQKQNKLGVKFIEDADHTFSKYKPRKDVLDSITQHLKTKYDLINKD